LTRLPDYIDRIIQKGEGFSVEFKQRISSPKKIAKEIAAFSNTKGGYLLIGVDDKRQITGVDSIETEKEALLTASKNLCIPPVPLKIKPLHIDNKSILLVRIDEGKNKPYQCVARGDKEKIYIRLRDKNVLATRDVVRSMKDEHSKKRKKTKLDKNGKKLLVYLEKNERITLNEFTKLTNISKRRATRILSHLVQTGLIRNHTMEREDFYTLSFQ
jgi:predicted HTH transcriptional regulator